MPHVHVSADEMAADLVLDAGERVTSAALVNVLLARGGVRHGLAHAVLAALPEQVGPATVRVATGDTPESANAGTMTLRFPTEFPCEDPPPTLVVVEAGAILASPGAHCAGRTGRTVTGRELPRPAGVLPSLWAGEGALLDEASGVIVASRAGVPQIIDGRIVVLELTRHEGDVTSVGGALVVWGALMVEGSVGVRAKIVAQGEVYVLGDVAGGHIEAGGRIVVVGEVRREAQLDAGSNVFAGRLENCLVTASGAVQVGGDAIRARIAARSVYVGGAIAGGAVTVEVAVSAATLGNRAGEATTIQVVPPPQPIDEASMVARERRDVAEKCRRLEAARGAIRRQGTGELDQGARGHVERLIAAIGQLRGRDTELTALAARLPAPRSVEEPMVKVLGDTWPGAKPSMRGLVETEVPVGAPDEPADASPGLVAFLDALEAHCGRRLAVDEAYWVSHRLGPAFAPQDVPEWSALARALRSHGGLADRVVATLVEPDTMFFRDEAAFAALPSYLARFSTSELDPPIIWSLGCATGQEVFSALIALGDALPSATPYRVYGVELVESLLDRARLATYSSRDLARGLTDRRRALYFEPLRDTWRVRAPLRDAPRWVRGNLADTLPNLPRPHIVLCRYVLESFAPAARAAALEQIAERMRPGGILVLGWGETAMVAIQRFAPLAGGPPGTFIRLA